MATTTNFGWETPDDTDLVKDGAAAMRTLGNSIDTSFVDLKGGTTGQVLSKASGTDLDFTWVAQDDSNAIQNAIVDAKGDLISATAADTPARLAVGTNGHVLTADSTTATGLKWAAVSGGKVLQVVSATYSTSTQISSTSLTDTGLSASITPSSASSKVLVLITQQGTLTRQSNSHGGTITILRGSTNIYSSVTESVSLYTSNSVSVEMGGYWGLTYLDSPATTSATTYKTQASCLNAGATTRFDMQRNNSTSSIVLLEIGA